MPKQAVRESAIHHLLLQARRVAEVERALEPDSFKQWEQFVLSLQFSSVQGNTLVIDWKYPKPGSHAIDLKQVSYYVRGDTPATVEQQKIYKENSSNDGVREKNDAFFFETVCFIAKKAGLRIHKHNTSTAFFDDRVMKRFYDESHLSDEWVNTENISTIDIHKANQACTAPELRYIHTKLGNVRGKTVLDIGCGLGEASVYFAHLGAKVTAVDISEKMLEATKALANKYNVRVNVYRSSIEYLHLPKFDQFDIVYVGNLFHHVDINLALPRLLTYLKSDGILVCWEPVDYNPLINIYRRIAQHVRSRDERPFRLSDIRLFQSQFISVQIRWFWLTTLIIFVYMACIERRNPNKERYWKIVVRESDKWAWLYQPLERIDTILLKIFPWLGPLCWNVVLICKKPRYHIKKTR